MGISHDFFNVLAFRHQARHPTLKNSYFVGASVHPGTGVPIAIAGSRLVTETILEDLAVPLPATYTTSVKPADSAIDMRHPVALKHRMEEIGPKLVYALIGVLLTYLWMQLRF